MDHSTPTIQQTVIEPSRRRLDLQLKSVWAYRELLFFLVWRDIKVRYKQTALGVAWVVLQPLASMVVFTFLFGNLLAVPSGGVPYPLFAFAALLPWNYFSSSLIKSSSSVVNDASLVTKVYFPRLIIPLAGVFSGLVDFGIAFLIFMGLMAYFRTPLNWTILALPVLLVLALLTALGFGLWLSALNVRYRDIKHLLPFLVQIWLFVTPVVYASTLFPERYRWLLALNPMTGVVEGFRWALLGAHLEDAAAPGGLFAASIAISLVVLLGGAAYFRRTERDFADII